MAASLNNFGPGSNLGKEAASEALSIQFSIDPAAWTAKGEEVGSRSWRWQDKKERIWAVAILSEKISERVKS